MQNCNNQSYCRYCGYMIDADSKYCIYCGVKVSYSNTSYYKLKRVVLKFFKVILGTIMAVFGGLIPFLIAYLLFPYGIVYGVAGAFIGVTLSELSAFIFLLIVLGSISTS